VDPLSRPLSRRQLLRYSAGGLALSGLGPLLAACGGGDDDEGGGEAAGGGGGGAGGGNIKMWWWGEQEAVGTQKWVDDTIAKFKEESGTTVEATLMDTDVVIPQFTEAAAAGNVPDVQFLFNGIYHMENVWLGYLDPLDDLVSAEVLENSNATNLSKFEGKQYRVGFYPVGLGMAYNKDLFEQAGLDPDNPPADWDAFLDACDKLKSSGVIPIGAGVKDGFTGEWYLGNALTQNLDSAQDALNLFVGELDWREPRYHEHWVRLEELKTAGYINDDVVSLELYQGIQLYDTGKAAMCFNVTPGVPNSQEQLGAEKVGYMKMPTFGTGAMADKPINDTQGFGIPSDAEDKENAAAFLEFMHSPDRVNALWELARTTPANKTFDGSAIDDPLLKSIHEQWVLGDSNVYIPDLMPTLFWTDAMFVASQRILEGTLTGEESGELAAEVTEKWKQQNPDLVENYTTWGQDLSA
jgi:ABC-type glycerol-3-phosphate transport system substrate-binding protein